MLDQAQEFVSRIDFQDLDHALDVLCRANAFLEPSERVSSFRIRVRHHPAGAGRTHRFRERFRSTIWRMPTAGPIASIEKAAPHPHAAEMRNVTQMEKAVRRNPREV